MKAKPLARVIALLSLGVPCTGRAAEPRSPARSAPGAQCADTTAQRATSSPACSAEHPREPHYGRAALEVAGVLALGTAQYWISASANAEDWDFPAWGKRLSAENVRFDNNTHLTNNLLHPLAGAAYYGVARSNGLNVCAAALYNMAANAIWEGLLEWREKVSINDLIDTSVGGFALGEFFFQLGQYVNSAPGGGAAAQRWTAHTVGFPVWINSAGEGTADSNASQDRLGFSAAYQHRFTLDLVDARNAVGNGTESTLGIRLDATLAHLGIGDGTGLFADGNWTRARLSLAWSRRGLRDLELEADAILAGAASRQTGTLGTLGWLLGIGTGMSFLDRQTSGVADQVAQMHMTSASGAIRWDYHDLQASLLGRLNGDFATIRALALPALRSADPGAVLKSTFQRGYQYHVGASVQLEGALRYGLLRLEGSYSVGRYTSIEGLDRRQEAITRDVQGHEALADLRGQLALEPARWWRISFGYRRSTHDSQLAAQRARRRERRWEMGAGLAF